MPAPCFANGWGTAISIPFKPATVFRDQGGFDSGKKKTIFFLNLGRLKFLKKIPFSVENFARPYTVETGAASLERLRNTNHKGIFLLLFSFYYTHK